MFKPKLRFTGSGLCLIGVAGLINGGFVQRNVETISRLRGQDRASRNNSPTATSIGYSRTPRRKLLRVTIRAKPARVRRPAHWR
jgi:hypothetical protein